MAKEYDKEKIEDGILEFESTLHVLNEDKSIALLSIPYPGVRALKLDKNSTIKVTIEKTDN